MAHNPFDWYDIQFYENTRRGKQGILKMLDIDSIYFYIPRAHRTIV